MEKIKGFWKKHKKKILIVGGTLIVGGVLGSVIKNRVIKNDSYLIGKENTVVYWKPNGSFINLETAKEILDLNANNNESFALFREGLNSDNYTLVLLSDNVVTRASD